MIPCRCSCFLIITAFLNFSWAGFVSTPCDAQKTDAKNKIAAPFTCGSTECPSSVKLKARIVQQANLPLEGWFVYIEGSTVYKSPIKQFQPTQLATGANAGPQLMVSDDGNHVYHTNKIMQASGSASANVMMTLSGYSQKGATLLRGSPKGLEVAVAFRKNTNSALMKFVGYQIETSSGVKVGSSRNLTADLPLHYEFAAAHHTIFAQGPSATVGNGDVARDGMVVSIPNNGSGTAAQSDMFDPAELYPATCGFMVYKDGTLIGGNLDHGYQDCFPHSHKGFFVRPAVKPTVSKLDFLMEPTMSANWCPDTLNFRNIADFQFYNWSNELDWVSVCQTGAAGIKGAWIVNWKTNTWSLLTLPTTAPGKCAVYITKVTGQLESRLPVPANSAAVGKGYYLQAWSDLLGRSAKSKGERAKATLVDIRHGSRQIRP